MRRIGISLATLALAAIAMAPAAHAATVGAEVFGAYNTHGMSDVNDALKAANQSGSNFDELKNEITGGIAIKAWPTGQWMLSAAWEPLFLETEDSSSGTVINADAHSFQATIGYFMPSVMPVKYGFGGGVGIYSLAGETSAPSIPTSTTEGSSLGFHAMGMSEWTVSPGFAISAAAGWRWAEVEIKDSSPKTMADYSGLMARVGLSFYLPTP